MTDNYFYNKRAAAYSRGGDVKPRPQKQNINYRQQRSRAH